MMTVLSVTIDTNIIDQANLATLSAALTGVAHELAFVSVTGRERGIDIADVRSRLLETAVWDDSVWDDSTWGGPLPGGLCH